MTTPNEKKKKCMSVSTVVEILKTKIPYVIQSVPYAMLGNTWIELEFRLVLARATKKFTH